IRRLNRAEYNNTIRDLLGVNFRPADDFPADDSGYGFDNIGDVLSLSPVQLEKYLAAAEKIIEVAFADKKLVLPPQDEASVQKAVSTLATRAYRRPVARDELSRLMGLFDSAKKDGAKFEDAFRVPLEAILVSPQFLFRAENAPKGGKSNSPIDEYSLASRLSYFLWSSMPDEELFAQAAANRLRRSLEHEVQRMLHDRKSQAFVENFAGQWLQLRNLKLVSPDPTEFPCFDETLRAAMQKETELFFENIMREDRSVLEFINADYTFMNGKLASFYGRNDITGDTFQRVKLTDSNRGGLLMQASILTLTSNPTRTSPVKRGKWVLENILGDPPPPPPPDVPELKEGHSAKLSGSLRQRMEQHRANPSCAGCHARMDPIGFGFENFDGVGRWREKDGEFSIDASGKLVSGESFSGPAQFRALLVRDKRDRFVRCLSEKVLTYGLGRGLEYYDKCAVDNITTVLAKHGYKFSTLILEVARSTPFQMTSTD
ncbi:MAG TPA: DUF1592 domain-containing protein, partial [Candidatus Dormibacteraeota bacterium]|nr:DUF1592 domain-containing protein [Candidatus Dormibacteraeota bacterium]